MTPSKTTKSEETRQRIIQSAHKLFHRKGFEATAVREIVEDAGYAKGTFYLHFETKLDLLKCMINELMLAFNQITTECLSEINEQPFEQIDAMLDLIITRLCEQECCVRMIHTQEFLDIMLQEGVVTSCMEAAIYPIELFIEKGMEKGWFRQVDASLYAKMVFSMSHSCIETAMLYNYPASLTVVTQELKILIRRILENQMIIKNT